MVAMKNWSKGDRVSQPTYGAGTLVEVNEHHTVIDFDEHGRRTFSTRLVTLSATSEPRRTRHRLASARRKRRKIVVDSRQSTAESAVSTVNLRLSTVNSRLSTVLAWGRSLRNRSQAPRH
jgi:hypothetical protein